MIDVTIRVETETLKSAAEDARSKVKGIASILEKIERCINACGSFWEGEGQEAVMASYQSKKEGLEDVVKRFKDDIDDLEVIAGVYDAAEAENTDMARQLRSDVIS